MASKVVTLFRGLLDGMSGGIDPEEIKDTAYARGLDVVSRDGKLQTRPAFVEAAGSTLPEGVFQGAKVWSLNAGDRIVMVISGRVVLYDIEAETVNDTLGVLFDTTAQCYFEQADKWMVIQDNISRPVVLQEQDGNIIIFGRSSPEVSIPVGSVMVYAHQRLHISPRYIPLDTPEGDSTVPDENTSLSGRTGFVSSDVLDTQRPSELFNMGEFKAMDIGGHMTLPSEMGFINGAGVFRNAATGTGLGAVLWFGRSGVAAFDLGISRADWKKADVQIGQPLFVGPGTISPWSVCNVNDDVFFRRRDGLGVLKFDKSQVAGSSGSLSCTPRSNEVAPWIIGETPSYLPYVSIAHADNRALMTAMGINTRYFRGLISLDLARLHGFQGALAPSYDGLWTGLNFAQVLSAYRRGEATHFIITEGPQLFRVDASVTKDTVLAGFTTPIRSRVWTKVSEFDAPLRLKRLRAMQVWLSSISETTELRWYYRPSGYPLWALGGSTTVMVSPGSLAQRRRAVQIPLDPTADLCDIADNSDRLDQANGFQFALEWVGHATVQQFVVEAEVISEPPSDGCPETEEVSITAGDTTGVELDDFDYEVTLEEEEEVAP